MQFEKVFSERTNRIISQISTSFVLFLMHVLVVCYAFKIVLPSSRCVHCGPYNLYLFYQMFEFNKGRINLAEFNRFSCFNQALGFCDKLVFEKDLLVGG